MHRSLAGARPTDPALEGPVGGLVAERSRCMLPAAAAPPLLLTSTTIY